MGLYRRVDSPFWWMSLERPGRRPLQLSTKIPIDGGTVVQTRDNRKLAQAAYAARMGDLARELHDLPRQRPTITFAAYRAWYAQHVSDTKKHPVRERSMLRQLGKYFDPRALDSLTKEDGLEWRQQRGREVAAGTVNREMQVMKALLNSAVPKYLPASPWARLPELDTDALEPRLLEDDEEARLLPTLSTEERALVLCALDTLQRLSTVAALEWAQDHGTHLTVQRPKGRKTVPYMVPVSARLRTALDALAEAQKREAGSRTSVFASFQRERPDRRRLVIEEMFRARCEAVEIPFGRAKGGITFHCLRHTGASRMLNRGVDIKTVAEIGNWKNLAILQRYLHPIGDARQAAVEAVSQDPRRSP